MFRSTTFTTVAVFCVALLLALFVEAHRASAARRQTAAALLATTNVIAERDSTRNVALENGAAAALLGDSLRLVRKQVVQVQQARDHIDAVLGTERRARYVLAATIDSLSRSSAAATRVDSSGVAPRDVRYADFELRKAPYTVSAQVEMPAPPDSSQLTLRVTLDSLLLTARVGCAPPDGNGVRSASVSASGPTWAAVRFDRVEQDSEICHNADAAAPPSRSLWRRSRPVIGVGRVLAGSRFAWGGFFGWGVIIWG